MIVQLFSTVPKEKMSMMLANDQVRARSDSFKIDDESAEGPAMKKMKDLKDLKDISDSSSEDTSEDDKLQRMAQAMKTIIEVLFSILAIYYLLMMLSPCCYDVILCSAWVRMSIAKA